MSDNIPEAVSWWRGPIGTALLALALMVGGWNLSTWTPHTPGDEEQVGRLAELRRMADGKLRERLDEIARRGQQPPFQIAGRLVVFAGLLLFVASGVRMYWAPVPAEPPLTAVEEEQETASGE